MESWVVQQALFFAAILVLSQQKMAYRWWHCHQMHQESSRYGLIPHDSPLVTLRGQHIVHTSLPFRVELMLRP